jgi:hypothetical protein
MCTRARAFALALIRTAFNQLTWLTVVHHHPQTRVFPSLTASVLLYIRFLGFFFYQNYLLILASDRHFPKGDTPLMGYSFT